MENLTGMRRNQDIYPEVLFAIYALIKEGYGFSFHHFSSMKSHWVFLSWEYTQSCSLFSEQWHAVN